MPEVTLQGNLGERKLTGKNGLECGPELLSNSRASAAQLIRSWHGLLCPGALPMLAASEAPSCLSAGIIWMHHLIRKMNPEINLALAKSKEAEVPLEPRHPPLPFPEGRSGCPVDLRARTHSEKSASCFDSRSGPRRAAAELPAEARRAGGSSRDLCSCSIRPASRPEQP